jgi:phenylacetate-CoA ligase
MSLYKIRCFVDMMKNQWKSYSSLIEIQNKKLKKLINHAYDRIPYYRSLLDSAGCKPGEIQTFEDLKKIPTTSKEKIQSLSPQEIMSKNTDLQKCVHITTSGSTGNPLSLYYSKKDYSELNMNWIRPLLAYGIKPWHRKMEITGPHNIAVKKNWYNYLGLWNSSAISIFKTPQDWIDHMNEYRPDVLFGYSGSLKILANYILDNHPSHIDPRYIFGVSDLMDDDCRNLVYSSFHKKIVDLYGAAEGGCIAWECDECKEYHINVDTVIVEFLRENKPVSPGIQGRIVVTNLCSFAMPIIRYELGDIGIQSEKGILCGRQLPLMKIVEGRSDAFVVLPSGTLLSPMFFFGIMKPIKGIHKWRILQDKNRSLTIHIVPSKDFSTATIEQIKQRVKTNIKEKMDVYIQLKKNIPDDSSGKVRAVISKVSPPI